MGLVAARGGGVPGRRGGAGVGRADRRAPPRRQRPALRRRARRAHRARLADHRLGPAWIVVCLRIAGGDRPPRAAIVGVVVGFAGIALLLHPEGGATWWGIALVGGSALDVGGRLLPLLAAAAAARRRSPRRPTRCSRGACLLPLGLPFGLAESLDPSTFSSESILAFFYLVTFGSLIGYTAYIWLLANVPLGTVSTYAYVNPVVAIALGVLFLDEVVTWRIALGALVVLASVAVVVRRESEAAVEPFAE